VEPDEMFIIRQRIGKYVSATTPNNGSIVEIRCFPFGPPRGYITNPDGVEAGSNTSTIALGAVGGDEKGNKCLGV
jgi:hypothetical protein